MQEQPELRLPVASPGEPAKSRKPDESVEPAPAQRGIAVVDFYL